MVVSDSTLHRWRLRRFPIYLHRSHPSIQGSGTPTGSPPAGFLAALRAVHEHWHILVTLGANEPEPNDLPIVLSMLPGVFQHMLRVQVHCRCLNIQLMTSIPIIGQDNTLFWNWSFVERGI